VRTVYRGFSPMGGEFNAGWKTARLTRLPPHWSMEVSLVMTDDGIAELAEGDELTPGQVVGEFVVSAVSDGYRAAGRHEYLAAPERGLAVSDSR
jgi:hypothetical protein